MAEFKEAASTQMTLIKGISKEITAMKKAVDQIEMERIKANASDTEKQAKLFAGRIKPLMDEARASADRLELLVEDEAWPLPKMREILFTN